MNITKKKRQHCRYCVKARGHSIQKVLYHFYRKSAAVHFAQHTIKREDVYRVDLYDLDKGGGVSPDKFGMTGLLYTLY